MLMLGFTSLTAWIRKLRTDSLYALLNGCSPDSLPPLGSYFDLMDRLCTQPKASQKTGRKDLFQKDKNSKPSKKPGKGKKFPNKHAGITDSRSMLTCLSISVSLTPEDTTASVLLSPCGSLKPRVKGTGSLSLGIISTDNP